MFSRLLSRQKQTCSNVSRRETVSLFEEHLIEVLRNPKTRQKILEGSDKKHFGEVFRLFIAITQWEHIPRKQTRKRRLVAQKIVSTFVQAGSPWDNGCLSSETRRAVLEGNCLDENYFKQVKYEVLKDIRLNGYLEALLE